MISDNLLERVKDHCGDEKNVFIEIRRKKTNWPHHYYQYSALLPTIIIIIIHES